MKKVSVIIPTYNNANFIIEALNSVFSQTFKNYEIIIVDDGSTDETQAIAKSYGERIKYIYQNNQGLAVARNKGLSYMKGDYFSFLDADDHWEPNNLEIKMKILEDDKTIGAVFSDFILFNNHGIINKSGIKDKYPIFKRGLTFDEIFQNKEILNYEDSNEIEVYKGNIFHSLLFGNFINACSIVVNKEYREHVGLFKANLRTQQDYEYWLRFSNKYRMAYVNMPLVSYRRHTAQLTAHKNSARIIRTVADILEPYYKDNKQFLPQKLIKQFQRRYSKVFGDLGLAYLGKRENKKARDAFIKGFIIDKSNVVLFLYWLFSLLPLIITNNLTICLLDKIKGRKK